METAATPDIALALDADRRRVLAIIDLAPQAFPTTLRSAIATGATVEHAAIMALAAMKREPHAGVVRAAYVPAAEVSDPVDEIYATRRATARPKEQE